MIDTISKFLTESFLETMVSLNYINVLEILVIVAILYQFYKLITGTQAEQLVKGILILFLALLLSKLFKLQILGKILESVVNIVIFSIVVIFQPELRRLFGYLGQQGFLRKPIFNDKKLDINLIIKDFSEAIKYLSKSHTGALIVLQKNQVSESFLDVGINLDSLISTELILTIFHPNTPLHDGAIVINEDRIIAAGVLLPLTEDPNLSWKYGTRHRAAIGMSETADCLCVVVSEETGEVSYAQKGKLNKVEELDDLTAEIKDYFGYNEMKQEQASRFQLNNFFNPDFSKYHQMIWKKNKTDK